MDFNIFGSAPEYYSGLLGQEATNKLQKRATGTGIANALLALVAQPRNQGYNSALPYIGKALMAGQQAGQNVIESGFGDFERTQKIADIKRQQDQRAAQQQYINTLTPDQQTVALAYPESAAKFAESNLVPTRRTTFVAPDGSIRFNDTGEIARKENVSAPRKFETIEVQEGRNKITYQINPDGTRGDRIATGQMDAPQKPSATTYKTETDASGNLVYIPNTPGMQILNTAGQPTTYTPKSTQPKTTDAQNLAAGFYDRMKSATATIDELSASAGQPTAFEEGLGAIPFVGDVASRSFAQTPQRQQYRQAQANWVRANLRKESGAVIGEQEMKDEIATYFPQLGDSQSVIEQKKQAREVTQNAMKRNAGGAIEQNVQNVIPELYLSNDSVIAPRVQPKPRLQYNMRTGAYE